MIKNIELRRQNEINDIKAYRALIQKSFEVLDINENIYYSNYTPSKSKKNKLISGELSQDDENNEIRHKKSKLRHELTPKDRKDILNQIRSVAIDVISGYSLVFKKQIVKKELKNPSENFSEKPNINENSNKEEENIKEPYNNNYIEYKIFELNDSKDMQIDDDNKQAMYKRVIEINDDKINPILNIHKSILSGAEHNIIRCELTNEQSKEKDTNTFMEIQESQNNSEMNNDSINFSRSSDLENQEKIEKSSLKEEQNQIKMDQHQEEKNIEQAELSYSHGDLEANSHMIPDSLNNDELIFPVDQNNEINNPETNLDMEKKENNNKNIQESLNDSIVCESENISLENENKDEIHQNIENEAKIKDKKQAKELIYKIQNYRNLYGKTSIISYFPLTYNESVNPSLFPWYYIKCGNMKPFDIVNQYKRWIKDEETYKRDILKLPVVQTYHVYHDIYNADKKGKKKKLGSRSNNLTINNQFIASNFTSNIENKENLNNVVVAEAGANEILYCYCKNPDADDLVMTGN